MPLRTITEFKNRLTGGGARPNLFEVRINFLENLTGSESDIDRFMVKSAALPASNLGPVEVPFRGRVLKVAGDRTFDTWTVTVINDENFSHRRSFESWMQNVAQYSDHSGRTNPSDYMGQATVYQLGRSTSQRQGTATVGSNSRILAQYKFVDIFPTNVSAIDLSYDSTDTIEEFTVEFQIQYYYPESAGDGA